MIDYPNDYYNDAEYYNDDYDSYNSSNENYIDVDAHVKVALLEKISFVYWKIISGRLMIQNKINESQFGQQNPCEGNSGEEKS